MSTLSRQIVDSNHCHENSITIRPNEHLGMTIEIDYKPHPAGWVREVMIAYFQGPLYEEPAWEGPTPLDLVLSNFAETYHQKNA